jgi:hypothetical protein
MTGTLAKSLRIQQPSQVSEALFSLTDGKPVDLIESDHHDVGMLGQRLQVAIMNRCIGILLGIDHPDQHVHQLHQPINLIRWSSSVES